MTDPSHRPMVRDNGMVHLSLVRPVTMLMALLSAVVIGVVALVGIPIELIPSGFSPPFLMIEVPYPNATAQDVEDRITRPLEQSLATTPALEEISATSRADRASVTLVFEGDTDMDIAYREVRDRVARARPELPSDVQRVRIQKQSGAGIPVAFYGVTWDESVELPRDKLQKHLVRAVERIDGVAFVNLWGKEDREIRIELNRPLAEAAGVNIFTLAQKLSQANFNLASGEIRDPDGRFVVRSLATYQTVQQLEDTIVGQKNLRLKDIAEVVYDYPESDRIDRFNGRPSMVMFVLKESQANTVEVCDKIRAAVAAASREPALAGFEIKDFFIQGDAIRYSLNQVTSSGLQGGVLAIVVLLFFLRRVRLTLLIAASIPLSIFLSLPVMYFLGQSINIISLLGLMICVGLVVDNSVVVAENIDRYRERGMGPYAAALHGASEVALPITLATLTTMIVFAPAALLSSGPTQFFMIRMVTPVCVSLLASLFVALVLVPMTSALALGTADPLRRGGRWRAVLAVDAWWKAWMGRAYTATLGRVNAWYGALLRASLRRRVDVVVPSLLMLVATCAIPMQHVKFSSGENMGTRNFWANYSMPSDVTTAEAEAFFLDVERSIAEVKDEYRIAGQYIGFDGSFAQVQVFFEPQTPGERPFNEVRQEVYDKMPNRPGWVKEARFGGADGGQDNTFMVTLYGDDHHSVQEAREALQAALLQQSGVVGVSNRGADAVRRDELALAVDRTMTERFGIPAGNIASSIAYAIRGQVLPRFQSATEDREIEVRIRYRKEDREQLGELLEFKIPSEKKPDSVVPVRVLTEMTVQKGDQALVRNDKRVAALIRLELAAEDRLATEDRLRKFIAGYRLPAGISFDADQAMRESDDLRNDMVGAMILSTAFIFLVMGFLFESFILPMSVLPSIPLSFIGVWWFLMITGSPIDALAVIGILLLLGVVVNNGIVLVDFINSARASGLSREEAIVQAGMQRFRPILMTALTTVGGMIPLAFTTPNGEGLDYGPFGKTLVGGMTTATVLTLVVVPVAYTYFDDLRVAADEWARRVLWRRR
ncbi:efflux RND transporter permease subunit [Nannocystis pusilla]|uniref:Efflux RND transporter permease subunit n=1 Tax=Nannocystis pusilla TaxID=889268 RepID=A0ABS7TRL4_9BACT|nr:efflux RND transporter permease subunit [Nannocystis pusilla]MBZ5710856.1 efflux RND transporter permease subunit [Nannocystis pusilla]